MHIEGTPSSFLKRPCQPTPPAAVRVGPCDSAATPVLAVVDVLCLSLRIGDVGEGIQVVFSSVRSFQHMTRTFHDLDGNVVKRDSGIWINGFDYTGMSHITPHIPEINESIRAHCEENAPLCGFPWYLPVHFLIRWVHSCAALVGGSVLRSRRYASTSLLQLVNRGQVPGTLFPVTAQVLLL